MTGSTLATLQSHFACQSSTKEGAYSPWACPDSTSVDTSSQMIISLLASRMDVIDVVPAGSDCGGK
jgi:hypothetical protein